jgi:hypothetical protein
MAPPLPHKRFRRGGKKKERKRECFRVMASEFFPMLANAAYSVQHLPRAFGNKTIPETSV